MNTFIKSLYNLVPFSIACGLIILIIILSFALSYVNLLVSVIALIIFFSAVIIYITTTSFSKSIFCLIGSLFPLFSIDWSTHKSTFF